MVKGLSENDLGNENSSRKKNEYENNGNGEKKREKLLKANDSVGKV